MTRVNPLVKIKKSVYWTQPIDLFSNNQSHLICVEVISKNALVNMLRVIEQQAEEKRKHCKKYHEDLQTCCYEYFKGQRDLSKKIREAMA